MELVQLKSGLLRGKHTAVYHEKDYLFNGPHTFEVRSADRIVGRIHFQEGPIKEEGVNGVSNEDLIYMVIRRLEGFQNSHYRCRENSYAIEKLEEAIMWLLKRTLDREARDVEGTSEV